MKKIHIIGGGTFSHIRNHLALCAPAFGQTARNLGALFRAREGSPYDVEVHLTRMADHESRLETNEDVAVLVDKLIADPETKVIVFNPAMCDFSAEVVDPDSLESLGSSGKYETRLQSRNAGLPLLQLTPTEKILKRIRKTRKDIFLVGFKTTAGATAKEQYIAGLNTVKESSCNLVLANDTVTRLNMVIVPEEARYHETTDRQAALTGLVEMTLARCTLKFTRSMVVGTEADLVPWSDPRIPQNLRDVVDHCVAAGAYKPFRGSTAGHFAVKLGENEFLTSVRKRNFNHLDQIGLVRVEAQDDERVIAYGAKPSVGGQSQRIVFAEHPEMDCIVHFHSPPKVSGLPTRSQREVECGSHECGKNTSDGLQEIVPGIKVVMLDNHGPNIVFNRNTPASKVISFIEQHFDLSEKTGGPVT